jgi:deaminated glutathione amidase
VLHRADAIEQIIPIEIDLEQVRRSRHNGLRGLGQVMKAFRDRAVEFPVYDQMSFDNTYMESLGPLTQPQRAELPRANVEPHPARSSLVM